MLDFFQQRFAYIHQLNLSWVAHLRKDDRDIPWDIRLVISNCINARHIAVCEILEREPESELNDVLPEVHWEMLERDNHQLWLDVFMQFNQGIQEGNDWLLPRLFQALHENAQYIGQLKLLCAQHHIDLPEERLLSN